MASIDPGNGCNQVTHCLAGLVSEFATLPGACTCGSREKVSRMGFCCCREYPQNCQCLRRLTKLDYITPPGPIIGKKSCVNSGVSAQTKLSTSEIKTVSNTVVKVSNASAKGYALTEKVSLTKQPFLTSSKLLPRHYEFASPLDLINIITSWLSYFAHNDKLRPANNELTLFHSKAVPQITVYGYLQRLACYAALSSPILLSMMSYLQRLRHMHPALRISSWNVHRLLLACTTVASKCISDCFWTNQLYAQIGGVRARDLTLLELELLKYLAWNTIPHTKHLEELYFGLIEGHKGYSLESWGIFQRRKKKISIDNAWTTL